MQEDWPLCQPHKKWPCRECGTKHFEGCQCAFCREKTTRLESTSEYTLTRKQWIDTLQKLIAERDDIAQDDLFRDAMSLFEHMMLQPK